MKKNMLTATTTPKKIAIFTAVLRLLGWTKTKAAPIVVQTGQSQGHFRRFLFLIRMQIRVSTVSMPTPDVLVRALALSTHSE